MACWFEGVNMEDMEDQEWARFWGSIGEEAPTKKEFFVDTPIHFLKAILFLLPVIVFSFVVAFGRFFAVVILLLLLFGRLDLVLEMFFMK